MLTARRATPARMLSQACLRSRGTGSTDTCRGHGFQSRSTEFGMHHVRVAWHELIGAGGAADQQIDLLSLPAATREPVTHCLRSQLCIGMGLPTACRVDRVMAQPDAVVAQGEAARTRGSAIHHAQHGFDRFIVDRTVRQVLTDVD